VSAIRIILFCLPSVQAAFLGVVSYLFVMAADTPDVSYLTRLDVFLNATFGVIFVLYFYNGIHQAFYKTVERRMNTSSNSHSSRDTGAIAAAANNAATTGVATVNPLFVRQRHHSALDSDIQRHSDDVQSLSDASAANTAESKNAGRTNGLRGMSVSAQPCCSPSSGREFWLRATDIWRSSNPHRKLDGIVTCIVLVVYTMGVLIIFGRPVEIIPQIDTLY
jgi:hypothetical protein